MAESAAASRVPAPKLAAFVEPVLVAVGVPREDGAIVADCLVTANLSGVDSHGVVRLANYVTRLENGTIKKPGLNSGLSSAALRWG